MSDEETPRYGAGFQEAVRRLLGAHPGGWGPTYTAEAALAQELRRAYHEGRMDGVTEALGPVAAPGAVEVQEEPRETPEAVWERLGLFLAPPAPPEPLTVVLDPLGDTNPRAWAISQAMCSLNVSLAEATEFVTEMGL